MSARDPETELLDLVNNSGFPFQMAVTSQIEQSTPIHRWKVVTEEHPWKHPESSREGFVDQIIRHEQDDVFRAVLECKRVNGDGKWVFLTPAGQKDDCTRLSIFWTCTFPERPPGRCWLDFDFTPKSPESSFCVLRGDNNNRTMFENIADGLLPAVESIGLEEAKLSPPSSISMPQTRCFLPIVITNASLYTASFDPGDLDMKSGRLPDGKSSFKEVPLVRFRKSLGTHATLKREIRPDGREDAIAESNRTSQRTILVLNSGSLISSLKDLMLTKRSDVEIRLRQMADAVRGRSK
jgi:hypothetical protein